MINPNVRFMSTPPVMFIPDFVCVRILVSNLRAPVKCRPGLRLTPGMHLTCEVGQTLNGACIRKEWTWYGETGAAHQKRTGLKRDVAECCRRSSMYESTLECHRAWESPSITASSHAHLPGARPAH